MMYTIKLLDEDGKALQAMLEISDDELPFEVLRCLRVLKRGDCAKVTVEAET